MLGRKKGNGLASSVVVACLTTVLAAVPHHSQGAPSRNDSPITAAAMRSERVTVRTLLKQGVDVNAAQGDGMTALHWAAMNEDVEMAEMLLYAGANVKAATRLGAYTPVLLASKSGNALMVEMLLKASAEANSTTTIGMTPLMLAAVSGSPDAVRVLLDHGVEVNATEVKGRTALMFAAVNNRSKAIDVLMQHGADATLASNVVDVGALETAHEAARREREEERKTAAGATKAQGVAQNEGEKGGSNIVSKLFGWLPGIGEKKEQQGRPGPVFYRETFGDLVGVQGGMTALLLAARQGHQQAVGSILDAGVDVNEVSAGDKTSPLLIATINGHFDVAKFLLDHGADPNLASEINGATPLYGAVNVQWAPKAFYPQPRAHLQQKMSHLDLMQALLDAGADPNVRLTKKVWYSGYNRDKSSVNEQGATPFWRAAYAADIDAMRLLVAHGADPNISTKRPKPRRRTRDQEKKDPSGLPPVPVGGPSVTPLQAAAGVGYGKGFSANSHRFAPGGQLLAVKYLVEEHGADVNAADHEGYRPIHCAAARGDNEMIFYLVSEGADVTVVSRRGQTTADMANGPAQRIQPFPETVALLMKLGSKNSNKCVSC